MRIAYLSTDRGIPFGGTKGSSVHVRRIASALAGDGHEVLVLVPSIVPGTTLTEGVWADRLPGPGDGASTAQRLAFQAQLAGWLVERLRGFRADALYERLALHSAAGATAAQDIGVPYLVELNAPLLEEAARYRMLDEAEAAARLEATTLRAADAVLAVSPPLAAHALGRGARRVEVVQNGADVQPHPRPRPADAAPVAVFAGSLRPWHGVDTIARAWRLLGPAAPQLMVVGEGPARPLLDGLGATFVGAVPPEDVPRLLAKADIGLAPYGRDTPRYFSPLKLFEYLAAGLATVVADLPAARQVVGPDTAVVIPAGDARALADALAQLCADPARRAALGQNGRALIESAHTWAHRARRIVELASQLSPAGAGS